MNVSNQKFRVHVLQGTTGSGKTMVYFEALKEIISKGLQGLILLPEIGLTGQFQNKFIEFFGTTPAVWHSGISKKKKEVFATSFGRKHHNKATYGKKYIYTKTF